MHFDESARRSRTVRELGGEIWAEVCRAIPEEKMDWQTKGQVVDLVMAVLARHDGVVIENDADLPVLPLPASTGRPSAEQGYTQFRVGNMTEDRLRSVLDVFKGNLDVCQERLADESAQGEAMADPLVRLRLAMQMGLLTNVPSSVRTISVSLASDKLRVVAVFEREPTVEEQEVLLDAGMDAAGDFPTNIDVCLECMVDRRPMVRLMEEARDSSCGFMVYARHEKDYG